MCTSACRTNAPHAFRRFTCWCCTACATQSIFSCSEKKNEKSQALANLRARRAPVFCDGIGGAAGRPENRELAALQREHGKDGREREAGDLPKPGFFHFFSPNS